MTRDLSDQETQIQTQKDHNYSVSKDLQQSRSQLKTLLQKSYADGERKERCEESYTLLKL